MDSEIIDLNLEEKGSGSWSSSKKSSNFGGGIELLMNDKVKEGGSKFNNDIDIEELNDLENELNELTNDNFQYSKPSKTDFFSSPSAGGGNTDRERSVRFEEPPSLGQFTATSEGLYQSDSTTAADAKTWDGYGKFGNVPINPDKEIPLSSGNSSMSKEELLREKFKFLRKLEALEKKGVELSKKYTMESPLAEMQGEYETIMEEKSRQNSVKFQGNMMMAIINGVEFLNNRFDPFDVKLDGWGEQINENINDYDDIFGELYEKYKSKATMAPELKLLFQLGGSAMMVHMTNTMFKSAMPNMDDIMRQNPDLMRQFQTAAVNSMGQTNPGFAGFMGGLMNPEPEVPKGRGPPPPVATQGYNSVPPPQGRPGNNNYSRASEINIQMTRPSFNDGINISENYGKTTTNQRAEMKGPSDISDILSGLKTKTINIKEQNQFETGSTISLSDLKDMQGEGNMPKKSKRRTKSDKNTVSLDI